MSDKEKARHLGNEELMKTLGGKMKLETNEEVEEELERRE